MLRQPRLAHPVDAMLGILGVLEEVKSALLLFNGEAGVDPQYLSGFRPCLIQLSQLGVGGCQPKMRRLYIG